MTSPITTEEAVLRVREGRCGESGMGNSQPLDPEDPSARNVQSCSSTAGKKRKRRRKRHKTELRKEEQSTPAGGEVEQCELSSDEEKTHGQWFVCDRLNNHSCKPSHDHSVFFFSGHLHQLQVMRTRTSGSIPPSQPWNGTATPSLMETGLHALCITFSFLTLKIYLTKNSHG